MVEMTAEQRAEIWRRIAELTRQLRELTARLDKPIEDLAGLTEQVRELSQRSHSITRPAGTGPVISG